MNLLAIRNFSPLDLERSGTPEAVGAIALEKPLLKRREHEEGHPRELNALRLRLSGRSPLSALALDQ